MDFLIFWLRKIFPIHLLLAPFGSASSMFTENARSRGLLLGLPAIILVLLSVSALAWSQIRMQSVLESRYDSLATLSGKNKEKLTSSLRDEMLARAAEAGSDEVNQLTSEDERVKELIKHQQAEQLYLEKLISLNPDEPDYKYRLALVLLQQGNQNQTTAQLARGMALMNTIAPNEKPGYAKAHLFMAQYLLRQTANSAANRNELERAALSHVESCLVRQKDNTAAKVMKAQLLGNNQDWKQALPIYEELFETEARFYGQLIEIHRMLGSEQSKTDVILSTAKSRFLDQVKQIQSGNNQKWSESWNNLVQCMTIKKEFAEIEALLNDEEAKQTKISIAEPSFEVSARLADLRQMLAITYANWAEEVDDRSDAALRRQLDLLKKSLSYSKTNELALRLISRISTGSSELAAEAKAIYDPEAAEDAPAAVYNDLGSRALVAEQYEKAVYYFDLAYRKAPNNPYIMNNLAFTYLVCENKDADLALLLVNNAIRKLNTVRDLKQRQNLGSHFFDTRGRALMQMGRMDEAAAAFEQAMQFRPKKKEILESLIKCYQGRDEQQVEVYRRRLKKIEQEEAEKGASDTRPSSPATPSISGQ